MRITFVLLIFVCGCFGKTEKPSVLDENKKMNLELGLKLGEGSLKQLDKIGMLLMNSADFVDGYKVILNRHEFIVGVDKEKIICYIMTSDDSFISPEGIKNGQTLLDLKKKHVTTRVFNEQGFASYIKLESGWNAAFEIKDFDKFTEITDTSVISWFFKRKE